MYNFTMVEEQTDLLQIGVGFGAMLALKYTPSLVSLLLAYRMTNLPMVSAEEVVDAQPDILKVSDSSVQDEAALAKLAAYAEAAVRADRSAFSLGRVYRALAAVGISPQDFSQPLALLVEVEGTTQEQFNKIVYHLFSQVPRYRRAHHATANSQFSTIAKYTMDLLTKSKPGQYEFHFVTAKKSAEYGREEPIELLVIYDLDQKAVHQVYGPIGLVITGDEQIQALAADEMLPPVLRHELADIVNFVTEQRQGLPRTENDDFRYVRMRDPRLKPQLPDFLNDGSAASAQVAQYFAEFHEHIAANFVQDGVDGPWQVVTDKERLGKIDSLVNNARDTDPNYQAPPSWMDNLSQSVSEWMNWGASFFGGTANASASSKVTPSPLPTSTLPQDDGERCLQTLNSY